MSAYRKADYTRWQQLDFVVGIEVRLSPTNHPIPDICDDLKGKYPKDFKFTGWHPHCRCHAVTILKTPEEMAKDNKRIMQGEEPAEGSVNTVSALPSNFTGWVEHNKERIVRASNIPYFIKDNASRLSAKFGYVGEKLGRNAEKRSRELLEDHKEKHDYSPAQIANFEDIRNKTGYERGKPMTFGEADNGQANIFKDKENCAACVLVHELRLRGYNITANAFNENNNVSSMLSEDTRLIWRNNKGEKPQFTAEISGTAKEIIAKLEKQTQTIGSRYHIGFDYSPTSGHIVTAERTRNGLLIYDPQTDSFLSVNGIINDMYAGSKLQLLRVDKLLIAANLLKSLTTTLE